MPIHFVCECGKHLKARHRLRGHISFCPACGAHVKIPTGKATHRGVAADSRQVEPPVAAPRSASPSASGKSSQEILVRRRPRPDLTSHNRLADQSWYDSLVYTLPVCSQFVVLAAALALVSGAAHCGLSGALPQSIPTGTRGPFIIPCLALLVGLLSFTLAVLSGVLGLAIDGSMRVVSIPDADAVLRAIVQWFESFVAGPALLLAAAVAYLFLCGDPTATDRLILAELTVLAGGAFLVNLLLTCPSGGLSRLTPVAAVNAAWLLGWRVVACSLAAAAALLVFGHFGEFVLERLHAAAVEGFLWLGLWWFAALTLAAFTFRRLGLWYHCVSVSVRPHARPNLA